MKKEIFLFLFLFFSHINSYPLKITKSLPEKTYFTYKMLMPDVESTENKFLLITARRNEEQDLLDNIFSDPNLYISNTYTSPDPNHYTWSSSRFGDEIISIDFKLIQPNSYLYISVYCQFKCNFILEGKIYEKYELKENKIHTISLIPNDAIKLFFKSRKNFEKFKVICVSSEMKPFRIYLAKKDPSSSNTIDSNPIFYNGYYFEIKKGDPEYAKEQEYEVLIENKEIEQNLLFWITFDDEETNLSELSTIYGVASPDNSNCYEFEINKAQINKNIVISINLMNGSGYIKVGGWDKVINKKKIKEDENTYPIISDKSILLTENDFKRYTNSSKEKKNNKLHFCNIASEETSYSMKIYYEENSEKAQKLNYLLPGISSDGILPGNSVTKYTIFSFEQDKDINIDLKIKSGEPKLYVYFSFDDNNYINMTSLEKMKKIERKLIYSSEISNKNYRIHIERIYNRCILKPSFLSDRKCYIFAVIECSSNINCLYNLFFDHSGDAILMKPKNIYSNVISKNEKDNYLININSPNIQNFAIILNQISGKCRLKIEEFIQKSGKEIILKDNEKFNQNYLPNVIEIKAKDFIGNNIEGIFSLEVIGEVFSSYNIYYYTFDDSNKLDHTTISMSLIKGQIIQDYIKDEHYIKIYCYDNSNIGNKKVDLYIYFSGSLYIDYQIYIFKNINDYNYEKGKVTGYIWNSNNDNYIFISKDIPNYIIGNIYIMIFKKKYDNSFKNIVYREISSIVTSYSLAITDDSTPLSLIEGVEFRQTLTKSHPYQNFFYNHHNHDEDFIFSVNIFFSKIKLSLKIGDKDYIYEKFIINNYYLRIESTDLLEYCPSENSCNIKIGIEYIDQNEYDLDVILLCRSSKHSIIYLKSGILEKRKILGDEKQYFVIEANPSPEIGVRINAFFNWGQGVLYLKKANSNALLDQSDFPDEDNYEYISTYSFYDRINTISVPYNDIQNIFPCKFLLTVKGEFGYLGQAEGEYSISLSNVIDDLIPNKNYRLYISTGEIKYFHFKIKGNKSRLSISMTNKEADAFLYLNYGKIMEKLVEEFNWKSEGNYNEYIDISIDDPYFISRKIKNLDGEYYLAVRGLENTYFNLFISDLDIQLTTISEEFPGVCSCEKAKDVCYFRYENINSAYIAEPMEQEIVFYFDFTYGSADIYATLFEDGNIGKILKNLPSEYRRDYKTEFSNQYLKIKLAPGQPKYNLDSVIILATKCKDKSLFDFNVRPLITSNSIDQNNFGRLYLITNKDNIIFISSKSENPIKLFYNSYINEDIRFEAKAISGKANIHLYIDNTDNDYEDENFPNKVKGYKHLSYFSVENNTNSYFGTISAQNSYGQNIFFELDAKEDCLFSLFLHHEQEKILIQMNKNIQISMKDRKLYVFFELLEEYEEVIFSVNTNYLGGIFDIYAKTSIIDRVDLNKDFKYSVPSSNNYDLKASTNSLTSTISLKIKNIPKDFYSKKYKVITMFFIESFNYKNDFDEKLNIIAYPNVNNYERIFPQQKKYIYSSLSSINIDKTIFTLKSKDANDDLLVVEISSCKGDFGFELTKNLPINNIDLPKKIIGQIFETYGKKLILANIEKDKEYYLSVYGTEEDEILFDEIDKKDIDFLLYYYTTKKEDYTKYDIKPKMMYKIKAPGDIILNLPNLQNIFPENKNKNEDLIVSVVITTNVNELNYMDSICYLTQKYDLIKANNTNENYKIDMHLNKNEIEIYHLNPKTKYYINVLVTNKKTGQIISLNPLQIKPNKIIKVSYYMIILIFIIFVLFFFIFYYYRKYRKIKSMLKFEDEKDKKIGNTPNSIAELKKMGDNKFKKTVEKYNSLTEDSGNI